MHAVIRHYHFDPKDSKEIAEKLTNGFMPIMRKAKGFVRYYWLDNGKGEGASFSVFATREEAEASVPLAAEWVHENFTESQIMKQKPEVIEGTVVATIDCRLDIRADSVEKSCTTPKSSLPYEP